MSSPPFSLADKPTEGKSEEDSPSSSLQATTVSAEEQDSNQAGGMSLLTSSFELGPSTHSQAQGVAENKAQDNRLMHPADTIVESTEIPCDLPVPVLAPLPPPREEEVGISNRTSASMENDQTPRHRDPPSSLPQYLYTPLRMTHPAVRPQSVMSHRTRTPSPEISSERQKTPTPDQRAVLFDRNESHGQSTHTSEPPQLAELDPRDPEDVAFLDFAAERHINPSRRLDTDHLPRQGHTESTVQNVQKGK
jgi:hypothetical protein